jgi:hypothetical protein
VVNVNFVTCKTVAMSKAEEVHPSIKSDEAICQIEKMASHDKFSSEGY